jgi:ribosome-associated translation inhibitor RaiA
LVHIVFHAHHADVTDALQQRAEQAVRKLAARLRGATDASIRFVKHGATPRVEIMLRVARRKPLVAEGEGSRFEFALNGAVERLSAHVAHVRAERARKRHAIALRNGTTDTVEELDDEQSDLLIETAAPPPRPVAGA